jgi:hypothetical protein
MSVLKCPTKAVALEKSGSSTRLSREEVSMLYGDFSRDSTEVRQLSLRDTDVLFYS